EVAEVESVRQLVEAVQRAATRPGGARARPEAPADRRWIAPRHLGHRLVAALLFALNGLLMRLLFRLKPEGLEAAPAEGPLIIVANHVSDLDPLVMAAALPRTIRRRVY